MFPLTQVQKQELNYHSIDCLKEYFNSLPLKKKLLSSGTCEFVRLGGTANLITCFKRVRLAVFVLFWRQKRIKVWLQLAKDVLSRYFLSSTSWILLKQLFLSPLWPLSR